MPIRIGWKSGSRIKEKAQAQAEVKVKERNLFFQTMTFTPLEIITRCIALELNLK